MPDYPDFWNISYILEQASALYFARIFMKLDSPAVVTDVRIIATGQIWWVANTVRVQDDGVILALGDMYVVGVE